MSNCQADQVSLAFRGRGIESALPLFSGAATQDHADLIQASLMSPTEFGSLFPFPTVSQSHPAYTAGGFVTGNLDEGSRVTMMNVYMTTKGLKSYGYQAEAISALDAVLAKFNPFYSDYNPETGAPDANGSGNSTLSAAAFLLAYKDVVLQEDTTKILQTGGVSAQIWLEDLLDYTGTPTRLISDDQTSMYDGGNWHGWGVPDTTVVLVDDAVGFSGPFLTAQASPIALSDGLLHVRLRDNTAVFWNTVDSEFHTWPGLLKGRYTFTEVGTLRTVVLEQSLRSVEDTNNPNRTTMMATTIVSDSCTTTCSDIHLVIGGRIWNNSDLYDSTGSLISTVDGVKDWDRTIVQDPCSDCTQTRYVFGAVDQEAIKFNENAQLVIRHSKASIEDTINCSITTCNTGSSTATVVDAHSHVIPMAANEVLYTSVSYLLAPEELQQVETFLGLLHSSPDAHMDESADKWDTILSNAIFDISSGSNPTGSTTPQTTYDALVIKAIATLRANMRSPAGAMTMGGIFNSSLQMEVTPRSSWMAAAALSPFSVDDAIKVFEGAMSHQIDGTDKERFFDTGLVPASLSYTTTLPSAGGQPPMASWSATKVIGALQKATPAIDHTPYVTKWIPIIEQYQNWWTNTRDSNGNGVPEYGATVDESTSVIHPVTNKVELKFNITLPNNDATGTIDGFMDSCTETNALTFEYECAGTGLYNALLEQNTYTQINAPALKLVASESGYSHHPTFGNLTPEQLQRYADDRYSGDYIRARADWQTPIYQTTNADLGTGGGVFGMARGHVVGYSAARESVALAALWYLEQTSFGQLMDSIAISALGFTNTAADTKNHLACMFNAVDGAYYDTSYPDGMSSETTVEPNITYTTEYEPPLVNSGDFTLTIVILALLVVLLFLLCGVCIVQRRKKNVKKMADMDVAVANMERGGWTKDFSRSKSMLTKASSHFEKMSQSQSSEVEGRVLARGADSTTSSSQEEYSYEYYYFDVIQRKECKVIYKDNKKAWKAQKKVEQKLEREINPTTPRTTVVPNRASELFN